MKESVLTSVVLPLALFLIMLGMGLSLTLGDFKRVAEVPKAAIVGLFCQLIMLPLVAFGLIQVFGLGGALAVGLMIIAACPGGVTSNLISDAARAPLGFGRERREGEDTAAIERTFTPEFRNRLDAIISFGPLPKETILQVVAITILPVSIGMGIRHKSVAFADRMERPSRIASTVIFILITVGVIAANKQVIKDHFLALAGVTTSLNVLTMIIGFGAAFLARLPARQMRTISIESGIQNGTLAIVIATTIIEHAEKGAMALPGGVYSLVMFATGGLMMIYGSFFASKTEGDASSPQPDAEAA